MDRIPRGISGIYKIENKVNGKIYIGQSQDIGKRFWYHRYHLRHGIAANAHLQRSWNKYGESAFDFSIVEKCPACELNDREIFWIAKYGSHKNGYNQSDGGGGNRGFKMPAEAVAKIKSALTGRPKSKDHIEKMRANAVRQMKELGSPAAKAIVCLNSGVQYPSAKNAAQAYMPIHIPCGSIRRCCNGEASFAGIDGDGNKLVWRNLADYVTLSDEEITEIVYMANQAIMRKMDDCTKQKISSALCGKRKTPEQIEKSRQGLIAWHKTHINPRSVCVVCLNTGEEFPNAKQAADTYGLSSGTHVLDCCHGKWISAGKSTSGEKLVWRTKDDYIAMNNGDIQHAILIANSFGKSGMNPRSRPVICVTTNKTFPSIRDAAKFYQANENSIRSCCKGERHHAGKIQETGERLSWKYCN